MTNPEYAKRSKMKTLFSQSLRQPFVISLAASLLIIVACVRLFGEQSSPTLPSFCLPISHSSGSTSGAGEETLLPLIPITPSITHLPLPLGVASGIMGPLPGEAEIPSDPDESKILYGYGGPYYNTTNLDGQVVVLDRSVYTWPLSTWKATGMLRNQTRCPVQITGLTARLLGTNGRVLTIATAQIPLNNLRPGEPGPFAIEAPIEQSKIKAIEWHVDSAPAEAPSRMFSFRVYSAQASTDSRYDLVGSIHNMTNSTSSARIIIAWLDRQNDGKVLYVASPKLEIISKAPGSFELKDAINLAPNHSANFFYVNNDPAIVPILGKAAFALWEIAN